ncbi:RICIN domain-containing protein [Streptomyces sp. AGS-58]|uniref:RICIN domain-containing protein n=1 Tax=unclassified Streptomyces TaxID=2593676 RepID=UPI0035A37A5C
MRISRREVIRGGAAVAGAAVLGPVTARPAAAATTPWYPANRAPLQPSAFLRLPPGAVRARGWLATQLARQADGLCGHYPETSHFLRYEDTGWIHAGLDGWEEVPYWLRGFVDMAYVTGDAAALATASTWMDGVLANQAADGYFGPSRLRTSLAGHVDLWPHMPMLHALRSFAEYSGDSRVVPFLTRYFAYVHAQPAAVFSDGWGTWRWGDTIDVVYWLYNRTGDAFLLDLVRKIHANSARWADGVVNGHNVNFAQGFREPAQYWVLSADAADRSATYRDYATMQDAYGRFPGGGFAGDETVRAGCGDPRQGFETCGIVEYMLSHEILTRITGDPVWGDRTEELAFNTLPAALDPEGRATHYITSANSVDLDNSAKTRGQFANGWAMQSYRAGVDQYRCCPHNYGMGWPYYTEEMWLATADAGLCAALYGPSTVTAEVGDGTRVTLTETTGYPFDDTLVFTLSLPAPVAFPLVFRIPGWCGAPDLRVGATAVSAGPGPRYVMVNRTWDNGDTVTLRLPMQPRVKAWPSQRNAVSVDYGPLGFSLAVTENWVRTGGSARFPEYDVHAGSAWNYGLTPHQELSVSTGGSVDDPFTTAGAPVRITAQAQRIDAWRADSQNVVTPLQDGPVASSAPVEQVTLIPMGAARLRITSFPQTGGSRQWQSGTGAAFRIQNRNSGKVLGVDRMSTADSADVVQYGDNGTADHLWYLLGAGDGYYKVQNANSGRLLAVDRMSTEDSARVVQYEDNGTDDHLWQPLDSGNGHVRLRNRNSGKVLGVAGMSTADSARAAQFTDDGGADHDWRFVPDGRVGIENVNSGRLLAVDRMSTEDSARVVQYEDNGTPDHLWTFLPDADGWFRVRNVNSGKVLGVAGMSTADSAQVVQFTDNGTDDHLWRLVHDADGAFRIRNRNSGKVLAVHDASTDNSANVEQFQDNGTPDHLWRFR